MKSSFFRGNSPLSMHFQEKIQKSWRFYCNSQYRGAVEPSGEISLYIPYVPTPADISANDLREIGVFLARSSSLTSAGAGTQHLASAQHRGDRLLPQLHSASCSKQTYRNFRGSPAVSSLCIKPQAQISRKTVANQSKIAPKSTSSQTRPSRVQSNLPFFHGRPGISVAGSCGRQPRHVSASAR